MADSGRMHSQMNRGEAALLREEYPHILKPGSEAKRTANKIVHAPPGHARHMDRDVEAVRKIVEKGKR